MTDYTKTHSKQFVDQNGKKHVVIKPLRIEKTKNADGSENITIVVPRLSMKSKKAEG